MPTLALLVALCAFRGTLAFTTQTLVAMAFAAMGDTHPMVHAGDWMTVWGTAVDLGSLGVLSVLLRREGSSLAQLYGPPRWRDPGVALGLVALFAVVGVAGGTAAGLLVLGTATPPPPIAHLPTWAGVYSVVVWPVVWGFTEQALYVGYAAPRLRTRLGAPRMVLLVTTLWAAQHLAFPFHPDLRFLALRALSSVAVPLTAVLIAPRVGRLWPLALAHVVLDAASGALTLRPE